MNGAPGRSRETGFDGDWNDVLRGRGCPPPSAPRPARPIRISFTDDEIEERLRKRVLRTVATTPVTETTNGHNGSKVPK